MTIQAYEPPVFPDEEGFATYQPRFSVTLGELIDGGMINFSEPENVFYWGDVAFNAETYTRVCGFLEQRYRYREISIMPPKRWIYKLMYKIKGELAPKYNRLYALIDDFNPLAIEDKYGKRREIESDYPETLLSENADYISAGQDSEYEDVTLGDSVDKMLDYMSRWKEIDVMFLDELEPFFGSVITFNLNAD